MDNKIWVGLGILVGVYLLYKLMNFNEDVPSGVDKEIEKVINSEEYKVKGQYD